MYVIFRCGGCGRHLYAQEDAKTKSCPCGKRTNLKKVRVLARAKDAAAAGEAVRQLQLQGRELRGFGQAG